MTFRDLQIVELGDGGGLDDGHLICPTCNGTFTHVVGAGADLTGTGGRMNAYIEVFCEEDHTFKVIFHQHRGHTYLRTSS